jgi:hypothetical protein
VKNKPPKPPSASRIVDSLTSSGHRLLQLELEKIEALNKLERIQEEKKLQRDQREFDVKGVERQRQIDEREMKCQRQSEARELERQKRLLKARTELESVLVLVSNQSTAVLGSNKVSVNDAEDEDSHVKANRWLIEELSVPLSLSAIMSMAMDKLAESFSKAINTINATQPVSCC